MSDYEYGKCSSCEYEKKPKDELPCRVCTYSCCKWTRKSMDKLERAIGYLNNIGWMQEHDRELTQRTWIPCEERLPERNTEVLVYAIGDADGFWGEHVIAIAYLKLGIETAEVILRFAAYLTEGCRLFFRSGSIEIIRSHFCCFFSCKYCFSAETYNDRNKAFVFFRIIS